MTNLIREKRKVTFSFKRINAAVIRKLSELIEDQVAELRTNQTEYYLLYSMDASDSTSFESTSNEIFREQSLMDNKVLQKVVMRFYALDHSRNIEIQIMHSVKNENSDNFISVSGDDSTWVTGILQRLSEIISGAEEQSQVNSRYGGYLMFVFLVILNIEYYRLFFDYFNAVGGWLSVIAVLGFPPASIFFATWVSNELDMIYPAIELQTGASHMQAQQKKRKSLQWWAVTIILPLLLALIYDILKSNVVL